MNKYLTLQEVRLMIDDLREEIESIYEIFPPSKIELMEMKMRKLGIRVVK